MGKSREIKRRIKAVGNIKRITKTMQMIATARFQAAFRRATAAQPYSRKIVQLVTELASVAGGSGLENPLLTTPNPKVGRELVLVITSDRGLCGGYNANILRTASNHLKGVDPTPIDLEVVGKKGAAFFKFGKRDISVVHSQFGENPKYDLVEALAQKYMDAFAAGKYDSVSVVYMSFISAARQTPKVVRLLPLDKPAVEPVKGEKAKADANAIYDFSPKPEELLAELLPITVKTTLFQCFNESVVSEQIARMVAMKSATDAAGKMGKALARKYNRARQAAITTELSEIIAGAASLE